MAMKHGLCIVLVDWVMIVVVRSPSVALFRHRVQDSGNGVDGARLDSGRGDVQSDWGSGVIGKSVM
jgi:hypothetical protein